MHDELIHDRIVVGLHSAALSEKLQTDADLTLEKAVHMACKKETIKQQLALLWTDFRENKSMTRAVGSGAAGKAMASPLFAVTCRMYAQPLLVPRACTNV